AYEDACMDHAGEGIDAALFLAAVEALAFVESDRDTLLDAGLSYIDADSELARAIRDPRMLWEELGDWKKVQAVLAERYLNDNFTDVVINLACTVLGWLSGKDFGESICIAVNCGQDTDCTGATLGALLGILNPDGIEAKWLEPIGRDLVLSPCIHGVEHPPTLGGFTDLVLDLRRRLGGSAPSSPPLEAPAEVTPRASSEPADRSGGVSGGGDASGGFRGLAIKAGVAALDAMPDARPPEGSFTATTFPGNWVTQAVDADDPPYLAVRYAVHVDTDAKTHLMFNTPQAVKVWWGDQLVIDSAGGGFVPALHRTVPGDQNVPLGDALGDHVVTAVMARPEDGQSRQWCVALTDDAPEEDGWAVARNWLVDPFDRVGT
ncbi:MAG: ADP-ribosylglycohydrolase family protein, partial [Planctomycetota bacterium]